MYILLTLATATRSFWQKNCKNIQLFWWRWLPSSNARLILLFYYLNWYISCGSRLKLLWLVSLLCILAASIWCVNTITAENLNLFNLERAEQQNICCYIHLTKLYWFVLNFITVHTYWLLDTNSELLYHYHTMC